MLDAGQMSSPIGLASNISWADRGGLDMSDKRIRVFSEIEMQRRRERSRAFYQAHRAQILAKLATPEEREKKRTLTRARYGADPEFREKVKAYSAKWRANPDNRAMLYASQRAYDNSEKGQATRRAIRLQSYFNLTVEQYETMITTQNGVCAICREPETRRHRGRGVVIALAVDHDHRCCPGKTSCGKCVRGLLCDRCNVGRWPDDPALLRAAADYFESYQGGTG